MVKKLHWRTKIKREIERWEKDLQRAGRKNRWGMEKREIVKKYGKETWEFEAKRRKGLERYWKKKRDEKRYQIEKLKDKLNPKRVKLRNQKRKKSRIRKRKKKS